MKQSSVTLKVKEMDSGMRIYSFPCGETNCTTTATKEFHITTLDSEFIMPVCSKHAQELLNDASLSRL